MAAKYANDIEIAKAQRDFELKNASFDQEVQTKKAQSEMAYSLQVHSLYLTCYYCISSIWYMTYMCVKSLVMKTAGFFCQTEVPIFIVNIVIFWMFAYLYVL